MLQELFCWGGAQRRCWCSLEEAFHLVPGGFFMREANQRDLLLQLLVGTSGRWPFCSCFRFPDGSLLYGWNVRAVWLVQPRDPDQKQSFLKVLVPALWAVPLALPPHVRWKWEAASPCWCHYRGCWWVWQRGRAGGTAPATASLQVPCREQKPANLPYPKVCVCRTCATAPVNMLFVSCFCPVARKLKNIREPQDGQYLLGGWVGINGFLVATWIC